MQVALLPWKHDFGQNLPDHVQAKSYVVAAGIVGCVTVLELSSGVDGFAAVAAAELG